MGYGFIFTIPCIILAEGSGFKSELTGLEPVASSLTGGILQWPRPYCWDCACAEIWYRRSGLKFFLPAGGA